MVALKCLGHMAKAVGHFHVVGGSMHALLWILGGGEVVRRISSFDPSVHLAQRDVRVDSVVCLVPGSDHQGIENGPVPPRGVPGVPGHSAGPTNGPPKSRGGSRGMYTVYASPCHRPKVSGLDEV